MSNELFDNYSNYSEFLNYATTVLHFNIQKALIQAKTPKDKKKSFNVLSQEINEFENSYKKFAEVNKAANQYYSTMAKKIDDMKFDLEKIKK